VTYTFTKLNANHTVTFKSHNLPLEIIITCHQFHNEIDSYLTSFVKTKLIDATNHGHFSVRDTIPEANILRVFYVRAKFNSILDNFDLASTVPSVRYLEIQLGTWFHHLPKDSPHKFFIGAQKFRGERVGAYAAACLSDFQLPIGVVQHCRSKGVAVLMSFSACLTKVPDEVQVIHTIEVSTDDQGCGQVLRIRGRSKKDSTRYGGMLVSEYLAPQAGRLTRRGRSVLNHLASLEKLMAK
jgi:hypothetical protein